MKTRSLAFLGASLLIVLASACGDDGGSNNGTCGDGHTTGAETCDDGNTTSGDGCSSSCKTETGGHCGDGTIDVASEQCDDGNTTAGDGCSATCQNESSGMCGNGAINGSEACDDGDMMSGDGCSSTCTVESGYTCTGTPSVCTMTSSANGMCASPFSLTFTGTTTLTATATGDTTTATDQVGDAPCDNFTEGAGGKDHVYVFTLPAALDVQVLVTPTAPFDPIVRLSSMACMPTTEIIDIAGDDGCSDGGFEGDPEELDYVRLGAGTYYILVDGFDDTSSGAYTVTVTATPSTCGNGMLTAGETCDDGNNVAADGCSPSCTIETGFTCRTPNITMPSDCRATGCGNGYVETGETCDDHNIANADGCSSVCAVETGFVCNFDEPSFCAAPGCGNGVYEAATEECDDHNVVAGDRCSPTCTLESDVTEVEPNDAVATAQALTAGSHIIRGSLIADDSDLYTFTLAVASHVEIETYDAIDGINNYAGLGTHVNFDCYTDDTVIAIYNSTGDPTDDFSSAAIGDDEDGDLSCSYIGPLDGPDSPVETGADPNQGKNLPAGTYTIRVVDYTGTAEARYIVDLKITPASGAPETPALGDLTINEFLAADGPATGGLDSNCDGSFTGTNDEFIELVNVSAKTLDLTGLTIKDGGVPTAMPPIPPQLEFTFGAGTNLGPGSLTLAPGKAVVIWAGGAPACTGVTNWFTPVATQQTLSLNDAGDTITVATGGATPVTIVTTTYSTQTVGTSSNLNPDAVAGSTYALHSAITGHLGNASPGKKVDGAAY